MGLARDAYENVGLLWTCWQVRNSIASFTVYIVHAKGQDGQPPPHQ